MTDFLFDVAGEPDPNSDDELTRAHTHCAGHREEILRSDACGCFCCSAIFAPTAIAEWIEERDGWFATRPDPWTAICPHCGIDAVIGTASGFPANDVAFLQSMNARWFQSCSK